MRARFLPFAAFPFFVLACFRLDADPQFDAGAFHFDAGTFDGTLPDGASPDGQTDAPVEAGPRAVKVVVLKGGLPESGVNVVFQDATGAVVEAKTTAVDGTASRVVDPGTMVTVALGNGLARKLVTVLAVQPGDVLTALDDPGDVIRRDPVSVDMPANPPVGTVYYDSHSGPCQSIASQTTPTAYTVSSRDCQRAGKFPVLSFARDANAVLLGFAFKNGNVVLGDAGATQVTGLSAWTAPGSVVLMATNVQGTQAVRVAYSEIVDGIAYSSDTQLAPMGGTATSTFVTYPGYADAVQLEAGGIASQTTVLSSITKIAKRIAAPAATESIDLSKLLPAVTNAVADNSNVARPAMTLMLAGTVTGGDGLIVAISWTSRGDAGTSAGQWIIVAPPTTTKVSAPAMPGALSAWLPPSGASFDLPTAAIVDSDLLPGYDQLRGVFATFPSPNSYSPDGVTVPALPVNQTLRVSAIVPTPM